MFERKSFSFAVTLAPLINIIFALGKELGWRGYLPKPLSLGQWPAILISSAVWVSGMPRPFCRDTTFRSIRILAFGWR
jgi:membrane protease YdiL (CAAX protease family)